MDGLLIRHDKSLNVGRFIQKGEPVATISSGPWIVRALARGNDMANAKPHVGQAVDVKLAGDGSKTLRGTVTHVAPSGSREINSPALTQLGGGSIAVSPSEMLAAEPFFEITVRLADQSGHGPVHGTTARVSIGAKPQTIGVRLYRSTLRFTNKLRS